MEVGGREKRKMLEGRGRRGETRMVDSKEQRGGREMEGVKRGGREMEGAQRGGRKMEGVQEEEGRWKKPGNLIPCST